MWRWFFTNCSFFFYKKGPFLYSAWKWLSHETKTTVEIFDAVNLWGHNSTGFMWLCTNVSLCVVVFVRLNVLLCGNVYSYTSVCSSACLFLFLCVCLYMCVVLCASMYIFMLKCVNIGPNVFVFCASLSTIVIFNTCVFFCANLCCCIFLRTPICLYVFPYGLFRCIFVC